MSLPNMKFTKEDLAKYINCWHYLDPHIACTGAQKNFIVFMKSLNDKKFISDDVYPLITNEIGNQIDIHFEDDLQLAELIIKKNNQ